MNRRDFLRRMVYGAVCVAEAPTVVALVKKVLPAAPAASAAPAWSVADLATFDQLLKEHYERLWCEQFNSLTSVYKQFRRRTVTFRGRRMLVAVRMQKVDYETKSLSRQTYGSWACSSGRPSTPVGCDPGLAVAVG